MRQEEESTKHVFEGYWMFHDLLFSMNNLYEGVTYGKESALNLTVFATGTGIMETSP